ncbi:MAG: hypothetical protein ACYC5K_09510 [Saccharofermentanales bacterium]
MSKNKIRKVENMPDIPVPYDMPDWKKITEAYDRFVFDLEAKGDFLPLIWIDSSYANVHKKSFGLPSYVQSRDRSADGTQESINCVAAILGATLAGMDKSSQNGYNWVDMIENFFNVDNGEELFLDRFDTRTGQSFWYEIYPHILLYSLLDFYESNPELVRIMKSTAEKWYDACVRMGGENIDFDFTAFSFRENKPLYNGRWKEPDAAAGIAFILYTAYSRWHEEKFLEGAKWCLDYLDKRSSNPNYELLLPYGAYIAARYNAEHHGKIDLEKIVNWCFDGDSAVRPGWGVITEKWGGYDCHGLCGSITDHGQRWDCLQSNAADDYDPDSSGYAFAGDTFSMAAGLIPMVRYDTSYAHDIGKWILNAANNSRLFYPGYHPAKRQSCAFWHGDSDHVIAYEGLRKKWDQQTPYATGDCIRYGWGPIDLGLYGSSHVGIFGGTIEKTEEEGILKIDCAKTDYYSRSYPTYLFYNPYKEEKSVRVDIGSGHKSIYDATSHAILQDGASIEYSLKIKKNSAVVIVVYPADMGVSEKDGTRMAGDIIIDYCLNR